MTLRPALYASLAHQGQKRKYTNEPYFNHLLEVATILKEHDMDGNIVSAGFLHDILEDTEIESKELEFLFGKVICSYVLEVTDISKIDDGNREERKKIDCAHLAKASIGGKHIKLADLISNIKSITINDPQFSTIFLQEAFLLLDVLDDKFINKDLYSKAILAYHEGVRRIRGK